MQHQIMLNFSHKKTIVLIKILLCAMAFTLSVILLRFHLKGEANRKVLIDTLIDYHGFLLHTVQLKGNLIHVGRAHAFCLSFAHARMCV